MSRDNITMIITDNSIGNMKLYNPYLPKDFGTTEEGDEEGVGNWMMGWNRECMIKERIACPEAGYPISEAQYTSIEEWEKATGKIWYEEYQP